MGFVKYIILFLIIFPKVFYGDFVVKDVYVEEFDRNAVLAKKKAIIKAESQAFKIIKYFLYPKFISRVNSVFIHNEAVKTISKFKISAEKISNSGYIALVDYYFDVDKVLSLLNRVDLHRGNDDYRMMMIPLSCFENHCSIWETEWFKSWENISRNNNFFPLPDDIENATKINSQNLNDVQYQYLINKYNVSEILLVRLIYKANNEFKVIVERPITQQKKEFPVFNRYNQNIKIFLHQLAVDMVKKLYDDLYTDKVSVLEDSYLYHQIAITDIKNWEEIKLIFIKYKYNIQYIANNMIIIELRSIIDLQEIERLLNRLNYSIDMVNRNQWVISKDL